MDPRSHYKGCDIELLNTEDSSVYRKVATLNIRSGSVEQARCRSGICLIKSCERTWWDIGWVDVVVEYMSQNVLCCRMSGMMQYAAVVTCVQSRLVCEAEYLNLAEYM